MLPESFSVKGPSISPISDIGETEGGAARYIGRFKRLDRLEPSEGLADVSADFPEESSLQVTVHVFLVSCLRGVAPFSNWAFVLGVSEDSRSDSEGSETS